MQKKGRKKRIKKKEPNRDLKIYSPNGKELLYIAKPGFCFDYSELLSEKRRKRKYRPLKTLQGNN